MLWALKIQNYRESYTFLVSGEHHPYEDIVSAILALHTTLATLLPVHKFHTGMDHTRDLIVQ
jgi:hypothetical protein